MTNSDNKKGVPATATPNNSNCGQCTQCAHAAQALRRIDHFALVAMAGILASRSDAFALCDEGHDLALAAYHAAGAMESAARAAVVC